MWEDYNVLKARFPDALAWGQAATQGEGDIVIPVTSMWTKEVLTQNLQVRKWKGSKYQSNEAGKVKLMDGVNCGSHG
jgi:hypothetical protein